ncbi:MAG TPA: FHA domain-containing protein, partial [Planctomycetota bacterium]|nr:FHA domain-containing protein [Planctomycetota bacterium]
MTGATTTFGRKPGNSVQLLDASVSGKHAEIVVDERGGLLRDLGSTNGTRVNGERISEKRLAGGDRLMFGTIDFVFVDTEQRVDPQSAAAADGPPDIGLELEAEAPLPSAQSRAPSAHELTSVVDALQPPAGDAGDAVRSIGAEKLARSNKKSIFATVGLLVVAAGAGAAWWFTRGAAADGASAQTRAVTPVAGNLLASGYSFENGELPAGWSNSTSEPTTFETDRAARVSGKLGLSADLSPAGSALLSSDAVTAGKALRLACALGVRGRVEVRAGVRFESAAGTLLPVEAWGPWIA